MAKQYLSWFGLSLLIAVLVLVGWRFNQEMNIAESQQVIPAKDALVDNRLSRTGQETEHNHNQDNVDTGNQIIRHQDMLSEEMKQDIRDKLLLHGPMKVIKHSDGSLELPSNGRFTQIPVAVEMPDGSFQIKEYTVLPE